MSALDQILDGSDDPACVIYNTDDRYFDIADVRSARAELAELRRQCEDYRLLALVAGWHLATSFVKKERLYWHHNRMCMHLSAELPDDGFGLPVLTHEARAALRKAIE